MPRLPDERGHFGAYGGRYVSETLMPAIPVGRGPSGNGADHVGKITPEDAAPRRERNRPVARVPGAGSADAPSNGGKTPARGA